MPSSFVLALGHDRTRLDTLFFIPPRGETRRGAAKLITFQSFYSSLTTCMIPSVTFRKLSALIALALFTTSLHSAVYNLKVVTDASPDYSDMESMIRSIASKWETPEEKLWAMFYWN